MKITHSGIAVSYTLRVQQWLGSLKEEEVSAGVTEGAFFSELLRSRVAKIIWRAQERELEHLQCSCGLCNPYVLGEGQEGTRGGPQPESHKLPPRVHAKQASGRRIHHGWPRPRPMEFFSPLRKMQLPLRVMEVTHVSQDNLRPLRNCILPSHTHVFFINTN